MDAVKINKLDAKLREMFQENKEIEAKRSQRRDQIRNGNIIIRRKGHQEKRIAL